MYMNNLHTMEHAPHLWNRVASQGFQAKVAGENIAEGYVQEQPLLQAWMTSKGHRENILNPRFSHTCVGLVGKYATQVLAAPSAAHVHSQRPSQALDSEQARNTVQPLPQQHQRPKLKETTKKKKKVPVKRLQSHRPSITKYNKPARKP
jgi:hypothetical protein